LFLSEHQGDARPDTLVHLRVRDVEVIASEFGVRVAEPGLHFPDLRCLTRAFAVADPRDRITNQERASARQAAGLSGSDQAVAMVGGWWPSKDIATIDAALNRLRHPLHPFVALALGTDGRRPSRAAGTSVSTARRRLRVLTGNRRLSLRCALARPLTGSPVSVVFFVSVPARHLDDTVAALRTLPELRMCSITSGPANLPPPDLWVRALSDVHMLEAHLENRLARQELLVVERAVVLRTVKHVGPRPRPPGPERRRGAA
jgi:hypothetical protein